MRRFYLFQRGSIWYIRLKNPVTGKLLTAKSSGTADKQEAEHSVSASSIPTTCQQEEELLPMKTIAKFLERFIDVFGNF